MLLTMKVDIQNMCCKHIKHLCEGIMCIKLYRGIHKGLQKIEPIELICKILFNISMEAFVNSYFEVKIKITLVDERKFVIEHSENSTFNICTARIRFWQVSNSLFKAALNVQNSISYAMVVAAIGSNQF